MMVCTQIDVRAYKNLIDEIESNRLQYDLRYGAADTSAKESIIVESRSYLLGVISDRIFSYWYGTPWDFNGDTRIPWQGEIACGYFVTTVLSDAGFDIPRIRWAQSASEVFILKMAPDNIKRFSNRPISEVDQYLKKSGEGLYLAGLDCHVGFVFVRGDSIRFIHANYYQPEIGVMSQQILGWNPLSESNYRIIGKLLSNDMMIRWIEGEPYE